MSLQQNISLKPFNTFGVEARARHFLRTESVAEILEVLSDASIKGLPRLLLGEGSNILFIEDWPGLVIQYVRRGVAPAGETPTHVLIRAEAGEKWHDFVRATIEMGHAGLENLSLIPGTVGAAPVQNIGAYGVELSQRFHRLEVVDLDSGKVKVMSAEDCAFGYRDSWFKHQQPGRFLITAVTVALPRQPQWSLGYGDLAREVEKRAEGELTAALISDVVCDIRRRKLPDPQRLGNAGSFFKNPVVDEKTAARLKREFPELPAYPSSGGVKLPAAWLIERCGWKGRRQGDAGVSDHHALVLVNHGAATGAEIWALAQSIIGDVSEKFGVVLEPEPRIPGFNMEY